MKKIIIGLIAIASTSAFAVSPDVYTCQVVGAYRNSDGEVARVDVDNIKVTVDGNNELFGRLEEPNNVTDSRPEVMPWSLSIRNVKDGSEKPMVLKLKAPNQSSYVAAAYAESGSKYIGFVYNSNLEALCIKK